MPEYIRRPTDRDTVRQLASVHTHHSICRARERDISTEDMADALADGQWIRRANGWELRGRNGVCLITDPSRTVIITVLPRGARPVRDHARAGIGCNRHRRGDNGRRRRATAVDHLRHY